MIKLSERDVQIALGVLWLVDGTLQLQHQMFTSAFATQVIAPAAQGQPRFVSGPMHFGIQLFLLHPAVFNALIALTQLGLGSLILWRRSVRLGLALSVVWSLIVWVFGEGYGGLLSGHTLLLMGAPGAAILYALLAWAVMPSKKQTKKSHRRQPVYWLAVVWLLLWVGSGVYQLLPGQNTMSDVSAMVAGNADGAPDWLATLDTHTAKVIQNLGKTARQPENPSQIAAGMNMTGVQMTHMAARPYSSTRSNQGYGFILLLAGLQFGIGLGILAPSVWRKLAVVSGIGLSVIFWVVGQNLGGYYTGLATDPNSGPLFVLLGLAILSCTNLDQRLATLGHRVERLVIGQPTAIDQPSIIKPSTKT